MGGRGQNFARLDNNSNAGNNNSSKPSKNLLPAEFNRLKNTGSREKVLSAFAKKHSKAGHEYGLIYSDSGDALGYYEGSRGSVGMPGELRKGNHTTHNHPSHGWGNFSPGDLINFANTGALSSTAQSNELSKRTKKTWGKAAKQRKAGDYTITRGTHFKATEFVNAINGLNPTAHQSSDYDTWMYNFLTQNQKKYDYKYTYTPVSKRK